LHISPKNQVASKVSKKKQRSIKHTMDFTSKAGFSFGFGFGFGF
jgi:hypothetical protein